MMLFLTTMSRQESCVFVHSPDLEQYHYPASSPFKTERAARAKAFLSSMGYFEGRDRREEPPREATLSELTRFHSPEYLAILERAAGGQIDETSLFAGIGTADTPVFNDMYHYPVLASGATIRAAELICDGEARIAFNPSGGYHHADAASAGGFCYLNDVVMGALTLAENGKRVFVLDIDAHHGNGTQAAFYDRSDIFTVSLHESGKTIYPWGGFENEIGTGAGLGYNVNLPFPAGTDDDTYYAAFREIVPPLIRAYAPDVIMLEIGMDILSVDPLTHLGMTNNVIADIIPLLLQFQKPILAVGGGGYSPEDTARGWALAWCTLCGIDLETDRYIGMGGMFLGSSEWDAGLRDMRIYTMGEQRNAIVEEVSATIETVRSAVFPLHGLTL